MVGREEQLQARTRRNFASWLRRERRSGQPGELRDREWRFWQWAFAQCGLDARKEVENV